jgi:3-hydroxyacyl-[acyl-carrier-protein] dehydratase
MNSLPTPHGPGFSFVDSFEILETAKVVRTKKWLDPKLAFFADHFPGHPLMPGVLLIESGAQAAGVLWGVNLPSDAPLQPKPHFALAQVLTFKLQRSVKPGQTIEVRAELERDFGSLAQFLVEIRESSEIVAGGRLVLSRGLAEEPVEKLPYAARAQKEAQNEA